VTDDQPRFPPRRREPLRAARGQTGAGRPGAALLDEVEPLLELRGVRAAYGTIEVIHGIDLRVLPGTVHAILGPNGAGKSTLLKVVSGLHPAAAGDVLLAGRRVNGLPADALARRGLCMVPEGRGIFPNLSVAENLWLMTHSGQRRAQIEDVAYARFPRLAERRHQVAGTLSGGEQQMLAMARGLTTDPALLLLDELSMGLAPLIVEELYELVASVAAAGVSIVVVEQFARVVLGVADRATVMAHGQIIRDGTPAELESTITEAYLGG
jgi:branched-chain amino acid transport system ATP-binding protein